MIYFVVNNDYHLYDVALHLKALESRLVTLILVPHSIDARTIPRSVHRIVSIDRIALEKGKLSALLYALRLPGLVRRQIDLRPGDTLFMYSEYELANQVIACMFRKAQVPVYLIEDGGFGTYLPFRHAQSEPLTLRETLQQIYERLMPGLRNSRIHKVNGERFRAMDDRLLSGLLLYKSVQIKRDIPQHLIARPVFAGGDTGTRNNVVFLNEPIYQHYQTFSEYRADLVHVIAALVERFPKVYFKFHPRESEAVRAQIRAALAGFDSMEYWPGDLSVEFSIDDRAVGYACSYISTGLLNLCARSIEPIFIYGLLPSLRDLPIFVRATETLKELGYRFPADWNAVRPTFQSGLCDKPLSNAGKTLMNFVEAAEQR
jgi:alpha-2,8-polysialyltransferase (POLYST)